MTWQLAFTWFIWPGIVATLVGFGGVWLANLRDGSTAQKILDRFWWLGLPAALGLGIGLAWLSVDDEGIPEHDMRKACDVAVQTLMTTNDLIVLHRMEFIIKRMDCATTRRVVPLLSVAPIR
jgi:hypothetical protein